MPSVCLVFTVSAGLNRKYTVVCKVGIEFACYLSLKNGVNVF